MVDTVYTIGYSGFKIDEFIKTLKNKNINLVVDVRSSPYSQYYTDYNKENLSAILSKSNIYYRNYVLEFGARQKEKKYYPNGYLDFELFSKSEIFQEGINKLKNAMNKNYTFALLCSEKDPIKCHRTILVSRAFHLAGYNVLHLMPNGIHVTQDVIEERLLNEFFPNRSQISMFTPALTNQEYIVKAYKKQNEIIGYTIEEND